MSRESLNVALPRFIDILNAGINIVTLMDGRTYTKNFNQIDLIYSIMLMGQAHEESAKKSYRLGAAWKKKQQDAIEHKKPMSKICPYWLELVDGKFQPIPDRVAVVKEIFDLTVNGYGTVAISKQLNARSIPVFSPVSRNKNQDWGKSSIRKIITSRMVLGEYQPYRQVAGSKKREPLGEPVRDYYPQVIAEDVFYLAQAAIEQRRSTKATKTGGEFNVWAKIGICAVCGSSMNKVNKGKPPKSGTYLVCASARKGTCDYHSLRIEYAEELFKEVLAKVDSLSLVQSNEAKLAKDLAITQAQITEKAKLITTQTKLLNSHPSEALAISVSNNEAELRELKIEEERILEAIASDKIISKEQFFNKLNLRDYEGRYKANSLLLRLGAKVKFSFDFSREPHAIDLNDPDSAPVTPSLIRLAYTLDPMVCAFLYIKDQLQFQFTVYRNGRVRVEAFNEDSKRKMVDQTDLNAPIGGLRPKWYGWELSEEEPLTLLEKIALGSQDQYKLPT